MITCPCCCRLLVVAGLSYGSMLILPVLAVACLFERMLMMGQLRGGWWRVMLERIISILFSFFYLWTLCSLYVCLALLLATPDSSCLRITGRSKSVGQWVMSKWVRVATVAIQGEINIGTRIVHDVSWVIVSEVNVRATVLLYWRVLGCLLIFVSWCLYPT